jgi:hypothetical protein
VYRVADGEAQRVTTGELRGTAGDVVTLAVDAADAAILADDERYRLATLPVEPRSDREFASLLRAAAETMGVVTLAPGSDLVDTPVGAVDAAVVAVRDDDVVEPIPRARACLRLTMRSTLSPRRAYSADSMWLPEPTATNPVASII